MYILGVLSSVDCMLTINQVLHGICVTEHHIYVMPFMYAAAHSSIDYSWVFLSPNDSYAYYSELPAVIMETQSIFLTASSSINASIVSLLSY